MTTSTDRNVWGRRLTLAHWWRPVGIKMWKSACGQLVGFFEPDGDSAEPLCPRCEKVFTRQQSRKASNG